jgi:hypothetical protein
MSTAIAQAADVPKLWVRIRPYNPARGYTKKTFILSGSKLPTFDVEVGWYELDARVAVQLKGFRNNPNDPTSPPVFQVVTREEAEQIDLRAVRRAAAAKDPVRIAAQANGDIPKPVELPAEYIATPEPVRGQIAQPAPTPAAAPATTSKSVQERVAAAFSDVFSEDDAADADLEDEDDVAPEAGHGDLTTADLAPAAAPKPDPAPAQATRPAATKKPTKR